MEESCQQVQQQQQQQEEGGRASNKIQDIVRLQQLL